MNRLAIAILATMAFSSPAAAQQPAVQVRTQDPRCQVAGDRDRDGDRDHDPDRERWNDRRAAGVKKAGEPKPCEPKPGAQNAYATPRAGDPNPYATQAGAPKR